VLTGVASGFVPTIETDQRISAQVAAQVGVAVESGIDFVSANQVQAAAEKAGLDQATSMPATADDADVGAGDPQVRRHRPRPATVWLAVAELPEVKHSGEVRWDLYNALAAVAPVSRLGRPAGPQHEHVEAAPAGGAGPWTAPVTVPAITPCCASNASSCAPTTAIVEDYGKAQLGSLKVGLLTAALLALLPGAGSRRA
jgi:predicted component of type VI protein secretion system